MSIKSNITKFLTNLSADNIVDVPAGKSILKYIVVGANIGSSGTGMRVQSVAFWK